MALTLGVHPVTIAKWMARHRAEGDAGLAVKPTPGRPRYLTEQDRQVSQWLAQKPTAHGIPTDLWTAHRVAELIRRKFGIAFHPHYLRAWLTHAAIRLARQRKEMMSDDVPASPKHRAAV